MTSVAFDLGRKVREECTGAFFSSVAFHLMGESTAFGAPDSFPFHAYLPGNVYSYYSLRTFWSLPKRVSQAIFDPDGSGSSLMSGHEGFFFHYVINKKFFSDKIFESGEEEAGKAAIRRLLGDETEAASGLYSNFLGESLFFGKQTLLQEAMNTLKGGPTEAFQFCAGLAGEKFARIGFARFHALYLYDAVSAPSYVGHTVFENNLTLSRQSTPES